MNAPQKPEQFALSPTHVVVDRIVRCLDVAPLHEVINHPKVRPHVGGSHLDPLDLTGFIQNSANIALRFEGFLALFHERMPGGFETHTQALPESRGPVVAAAAAAMAHWMFTRTNAIELLTRIPDDNDSARDLAMANGFEFEFRHPSGWATPKGLQPVDWFRLDVRTWMARAEGLIERGQWFHAELDDACVRAGVEYKAHDDDETHNRYVGAAAEMILNGQIVKGIHFFNRYAAIVGNPQIAVLGQNPLVLHIGDLAISLAGGQIEVVKSQ